MSEQRIAELEKALENALKERDQHKQSAETWRKRVEQAAEALADVLPGEVGRLDLLARIAELKRSREAWENTAEENLLALERVAKERDDWHLRAESLLKQAEELETELARFKPSGQVAEMRDRVALMVGTRERAPQARADLDALATKAQGYEAAVAERDKAWSERATAIAEKHSAVADTAARQRVGAMMANACFNLSQREHLRPDERQTIDELRRAWDALGPHPGPALLEQHRKEVEALSARISAMDTEAQAAKEALGAIWAVVGGMSDPASIAKSVTKKIAQARNEGLERARKMASNVGLANLASVIDAAKEPEQ